jgi:hypothetical protein
VNSVTACSDAATALPGSTLRDSTTPSIGERMAALARLVSLVDSVAVACATLAPAAARSAAARSTVARALSRSVAAGSLPPDSRATSSSRARLARASFSVTSANCRRARADSSSARAPAHRIAELGAVELDQQLALLHAVVDVDQHADHRARQLAAHRHRSRGLQRAGGGDGHRQVAAHHRLRHIARRGIAGGLALPPPGAGGRGQQQPDDDPGRDALPPGAPAVGQQGLQIGRFGHGRMPVEVGSAVQPPPSALYRRTWLDARSVRALAQASAALSALRSLSSRVRKSDSPAW